MLLNRVRMPEGHLVEITEDCDTVRAGDDPGNEVNSQLPPRGRRGQ